MDANLRTACIRETQKSLKFSAKQLIEDKIKALGVEHLFDIQAAEIRRIGGSGVIIFQGMQDHTADSVKSLEGFGLVWCEEAQSLSARSIRLLDPTIRSDDAELLFSWNPSGEEDPVEQLLIGNDAAIVVHVNYTDNPWCPQSMKELAEREKARDIDRFNHIWLGQHEHLSEKQIFKRWSVGEIDVPENIVWHYGADWGFANDATAGLRACFPEDSTIYVDAEIYEVSTPTEALPKLFARLPQATRWPIRADSARPETIDYMRRHGFPKMRPAKKGKGSIEDGITFIQGFNIVVHPRCVNLQAELKSYSYKVHRQTEEILPVPEDSNNHLIDALRYALEKCHRKGRIVELNQPQQPQVRRRYVSDEEEANWKTA